jgi:hypothetical protein
MLNTTYTEVGYGIAFVPSFTYNGTTYANVYLVAAHYAKPAATAQPVSTPTPTPTPTVQQSTPTTQAQNTTSPTQSSAEKAEQTSEAAPEPEPTPVTKEEASKDHAPVAGTVDRDSGNRTSGTIAAADETPFKLPSNLAYVGLGIGVVLVIVGTIIEIRRFVRHLPLLPHRK